MKTILTVILISLSLIIQAQSRMNEQRAIKETHIDFSKEYLGFKIHGLIEIDGHIFKNDTCKNPIQFSATLDKVTIIDTINKIEYSHRNCSRRGCKIVHLVRKEPEIKFEYNFPVTPYIAPGNYEDTIKPQGFPLRMFPYNFKSDVIKIY